MKQWSTVMLAATLGLLMRPTVAAQPALQFDAASVKTNTSGDKEDGDFVNGRYYIRAATLRHLVAAAYNLRVGLVICKAAWMDAERFDINAKTDASTTDASARLMLKTLLARTFELRSHFELRSTRVFVLVKDKRGPKLVPDIGAPNETSRCVGSGPVVCTHRTMSQFAELLPRISSGIDAPVADETGLDATYSFRLTFSARPTQTTSGDLDSENPDREQLPSLFEALPAQLGLKLKPSKRPIRYLIVDSAKKDPKDQ